MKRILLILAASILVCRAQVPPATPFAPGAPVPTPTEIPVAPVDTNSVPVAPAVIPGSPALPVVTVAPTPVQTSPVVLPPTPTPAAPPTPSQLVVLTPEATDYATGKKAFEDDKNYSEAVRIFGRFVHDYPSSERREEVLYLLGQAYENLNDPADALACYTYLVKTYSGFWLVSAQLSRGRILKDEKDYDGAALAYGAAVARGEGDLKALAKFRLAECLISKTHPDVLNAKRMLSDLALANPPGTYACPAAVLLADVEDSNGDAKDALTHWKLALKLGGAKDPAVLELATTRAGISAEQAGESEEAQVLLRRALSLDQNVVLKKLANTALLQLLFQKKDFTAWLKVYSAQPDLVIDSYKEQNTFDLGWAKFSLKDWDGAISGFDAYLKLYPNQTYSQIAAYEQLVAQLNANPTHGVDAIQDYQKNWPNSTYRLQVLGLLAEQLFQEKRYVESVAVWIQLEAISEKGSVPFTQAELALGLANAYHGAKDWTKAVAAYQKDLDLTVPPDKKLEPGTPEADAALQVKVSLADSYENAGMMDQARVGWEGVQELAQPGSQQEQTALERLMQIYYGEGDAGEANAVRIATELLSAFPKTGLKGLAEFAIGTSYFKQKHFVEAETWLLKSRASDPFYMLRATRGLVLGTFYRKQLHETESYLKEYESLPPPSDPAQVAGAKLPVELYLWLAEEERKEDRPEMAERNYKKVTELTTDPDYLGPTWRNLGKVQLAQKEYDSAVTSFLNFIKLVPNGQNDFETVIDLGEAQLNTKNFTAAKDQGLQALRLEPEGLQSARAQLLLADISMAQGNYVDAGKQYAAIAVLFNDDPNVPVEALKKAATAYQSAGDLSMTQKMEDQLAQWQATRKK